MFISAAFTRSYIDNPSHDFDFVEFGADILESEVATDNAYNAFLNIMADKYYANSIMDVVKVAQNGLYMPCSKRIAFSQTTDRATDGPFKSNTLYLPDQARYYHIAEIPKLPRGYGKPCKGKVLQIVSFENQGVKVESMYGYAILKTSGDLRPACLEGHIQPPYIALITLLTALTVNALADSDYLWGASVSEVLIGKTHPTELTMGMTTEQIKSVFYARSLPLTETGRKKPILHLVRSHQRRIKEGIDVDVNRHIRGIDSVDIHGMTFNIRPPKTDSDLHKRWS